MPAECIRASAYAVPGVYNVAYGVDLTSALQSFRLVVFEAVAQRLSFTQAAEILHVSQPAITSHIKALEDDLNVRLFERRNGKVTITPAGKVLQTYTKELNNLSEGVLRKIGSLQGGARKTGHWCFHDDRAICAAEARCRVSTGTSWCRSCSDERKYAGDRDRSR